MEAAGRTRRRWLHTSIDSLTAWRRRLLMNGGAAQLADSLRPGQAGTPRAAWLILALAIGSGFGLRVWLAFHDDGIYWPDEIYQSLEPAHRIVFGFGMLPWEYVQGARGWALPALFAVLLKLADLLHLARPAGYLALTRAVLCIASATTIFFAYRLARRLGASPLAAAAGAALGGLGAVPIYFGPRALGESVSMLPVVAGLAMALPKGDRRRRLLGVTLLSVAVFIRLQDAVLCAVLLVVLVTSRRYRECIEAAVLLVTASLIYGLIDLLTWGDLFHSVRVYLQFNLSGGANFWGTSPFTYYLGYVVHLPWLWGLLLIGLACLGSLRAPALNIMVVAFLLLHSLVAHKELRFILPLFPLLSSLAGLGLDELRRWPALFRPALVVALVVGSLSGATFERLTFTDIGAYLNYPGLSAYNLTGPVNRLLVVAHNQPDLCGIDVEGFSLSWTGGYTYLDRPVPMFSGGRYGSGDYNYLVAPEESLSSGELPPGTRLIQRDDGWSLLRLKDSCQPLGPPNTRLP